MGVFSHDSSKGHVMKRLTKEEQIQQLYGSCVGERNLVVGCGSQGELESISRIFPNSLFVGIDPEVDLASSSGNISYVKGDIQNLQFEDSKFDFVYCYHVLEHVDNVNLAVSEIRRVLKSSGWSFIGTPNKERIFGYLSADAQFLSKLKWNATDWSMRFRGKFKNEHGAHAGFTKVELRNLMSKEFSLVNDVTSDYYSLLYSNYPNFLAIIHKLGLARFTFPSLYFLVSNRN